MKKKFLVAFLVAFLAIPTLVNASFLFEEILDNDTTFAWTGYLIDIGMTQEFSISDIITPENWTFVITQPVSGMPIPDGSGGTGWLGTIDYYVGSGSPIAIGDEAKFGFRLTFSGSGGTFCTEQTPIPEPATMTLLCIGALALLRKK